MRGGGEQMPVIRWRARRESLFPHRRAPARPRRWYETPHRCYNQSTVVVINERFEVGLAAPSHMRIVETSSPLPARSKKTKANRRPAPPVSGARREDIIWRGVLPNGAGCWSRPARSRRDSRTEQGEPLKIGYLVVYTASNSVGAVLCHFLIASSTISISSSVSPYNS